MTDKLSPEDRAWVDAQVAKAPPLDDETLRQLADLFAGVDRYGEPFYYGVSDQTVRKCLECSTRATATLVRLDDIPAHDAAHDREEF